MALVDTGVDVVPAGGYDCSFGAFRGGPRQGGVRVGGQHAQHHLPVAGRAYSAPRLDDRRPSASQQRHLPYLRPGRHQPPAGRRARTTTALSFTN